MYLIYMLKIILGEGRTEHVLKKLHSISGEEKFSVQHFSHSLSPVKTPRALQMTQKRLPLIIRKHWQRGCFLS